MTRSTKARQFSKITIAKIVERDGGCIFCKMGFHMHSTTNLGYQIQTLMHIVNKSQGGLGIEENGAVCCQYHHNQMDNGSDGLRKEMQEMVSEYMIDLYPGWDRKELVYKK